MSSSSWQRRGVLRAAGVSLALPLLSSWRPVAAGDKTRSENTTPAAKRRLVCIGNMLGFHPQAFFPTPIATAKQQQLGGASEFVDFQFGESTEALDSIRQHSTVITGLDHGLKGGHFAIHAFLSGVRQVDAKSMPMANISVDQYAAEFIPGQTRFPTLNIGSESGIHGGCQISWTRSGTRVPPIPGPSQLFAKLFVGTDPKNKAAQSHRFETQGSILDMVLGSAQQMNGRLNRQDQVKLDEYLSSVRDVEKRIQLRRNWVDVPKPQPPIDPPVNRNLVEDLPLLYDLMVLALQTDSTRIATLEIGGDFNPADLGVRGGYHGLSHHGKKPASIEALITLEQYQIQQFARFVQKLNDTEDQNGSLLEQTAVLFGSGMGDANSHTNSNLPIVLAGGGFRHGRLLSFDRKASDRPPLTNLFVSMLQNFGVESDRFATSTGTLRGLA